MRNASDSLGPKLLVLKERFLAGLPQRFNDLEAAMKRCTPEAEPGAVEEVERRFHTIAGTAGTYGLSEVAALAAEGEETCAMSAGSQDDASTLEYLRSLVDSMKEVVPSTKPAEEASAVSGPTRLASVPMSLLVSREVDSPMMPASRILCVEDDPDQSRYIDTIRSCAA